MLLHKGGQINNVQLITWVRIVEMSQLQNCSVVCAKKGSYCENKIKKSGDRGQERCVQRMEVIVVKRKKRLGGGGGGGSRKMQMKE